MVSADEAGREGQQDHDAEVGVHRPPFHRRRRGDRQRCSRVARECLHEVRARSTLRRRCGPFQTPRIRGVTQRFSQANYATSAARNTARPPVAGWRGPATGTSDERGQMTVARAAGRRPGGGRRARPARRRRPGRPGPGPQVLLADAAHLPPRQDLRRRPDPAGAGRAGPAGPRRLEPRARDQPRAAGARLRPGAGAALARRLAARPRLGRAAGRPRRPDPHRRPRRRGRRARRRPGRRRRPRRATGSAGGLRHRRRAA